MDAEEAIRTRRTHKAYGPEPVDRATLEELLRLGADATDFEPLVPQLREISARWSD